MYYEATCGGGIPVIRTLTQAMQANTILQIKGIINGTTNYILSRMSVGMNQKHLQEDENFSKILDALLPQFCRQ